MAVDEKYVENVGESTLDMFEELGLEPEFIQGNGLELNDEYIETQIRVAEPEEYYTGVPQLSNIITNSYLKFDEDDMPVYETDDTGEVLLDENGEPIQKRDVNYRVDFVIEDEDRMENLIIPLNLKSDDPVQTDVYSSSKLFELPKGLAEMKIPGSMAEFNHFKVVNLDRIRENLPQLMRVKIVEKYFNGNAYNSFVVVNPDGE